MKTPKQTIEFKAAGDFEAYWKAESWCYENGYSVASMCSPEPTAILKGDVQIAKWKNLTAKERNSVDGVITCSNGSFRDGDITISIY